MASGNQQPAAAEAQEIFQLQLKIRELLIQTSTPDATIRRAAEYGLAQLEKSNKLYGLAIINLTCSEDSSEQVRMSAAITFKNFIKKYWLYELNPEDDHPTDPADVIGDQNRELIKQHVTRLMLSSPIHIQRQLSEVITIIARTHFPDRWPNLILELENSLKDTTNVNHVQLQGILQTAHSIFRRYRIEMQSNSLWTEIKLVVEHFSAPLTARFQLLVTAAKSSSKEAPELPQIYQCLLLCSKIYQSLVRQDLPEYFEDHIVEWHDLFLELLNVKDVPGSVASVIEDLKSEICEIASLFVQRYSDAEKFLPYIQKYAEHIWNLLVTAGQDAQHDTLVSSAIRYLVTVAERPDFRALYQDANVLNLLCQNVIIPNLTFREVDVELFEDDPEEYVMRDIEGSDVDTRRRAACDLVRALSKFIEVQLFEMFGRYIEEMLQSYKSNKDANWKHKDLAIFLYSAMAIKGSTRQQGTVTISQHVNVERFFEDNIVEELTNASSTKASLILQADSLRYLTTFRNYISLNAIAMRIPSIVKLVTSSNVVVRTYASITLEKLLTMRDPNQKTATAFKPEQFEPVLGDLIKTLFEALELPDSPENEYIMKAIMRLFSFTKSETLLQYLPIVVQRLTNKLGIVARNPSKPFFNHYLFETLALAIRATCSGNNPSIRDEFESVLFKILQEVLAQDVQEFIPYVLQLLNLILRSQSTGAVSERFTNLFQELLSPNLWEKPANTPPLTDLMHTYIEKLGQFIIAQNKLIPLLGIFQKLISSKATDHEALALLQTMIVHLPASDLDARIRDIFILIFARLSGSKTTKLVKNALVTFSLYAFLRGPDVLAAAVNQLQDKMYGMVLEKLYLADVKKVNGNIDRRICMCGLIKMVSQIPLTDNGSYNNLFAPLLLVLMELFELPPEADPDEDEHFADIGESLDFQAQYSRLNYATFKRDDPTSNVGDLKSLLATSVANASSKVPGYVSNTLLSGLDQNVLACFMTYCQNANVTIS